MRILKNSSILIFLLLLLSNTGCLVFQKISYKILINEDKSGTANIYITDITSDAIDEEAFRQDTAAIFTFMQNSDEFIEDMKTEGRFITHRKLIVKNDELDAEVKYNFKNISGVENINYEDGFYFITMDISDSIITTNGEIINSGSYKRILWDDQQKLLSFEMFSAETDAYRKLGLYYKKQE
ncbi:MAG: hypothetical protein HXY50_15620 [Ignavibacteriaceae bacterium]|nr:hypothetical protein [Ignavibacteriaceae bacterium]